jgi:hypothetical protein
MTTKHTPGPWRIKSDPMHFDTLTTVEGGAIGARKPFGVQMIVQVGGDSDFHEAEANARLIAAAPDLLKALKKARRFVLSSDEPVCTELDDIDAAIAKATGT